MPRDLPRKPLNLNNVVVNNKQNVGVQKHNQNLNSLVKSGHLPRNVYDRVRDHRPITPAVRNDLRNRLNKLPANDPRRNSLARLAEPYRPTTDPHRWLPKDPNLAGRLNGRYPPSRTDLYRLHNHFNDAWRRHDWRTAWGLHNWWHYGWWRRHHNDFLLSFGNFWVPGGVVAGPGGVITGGGGAFVPDALIPCAGGDDGLMDGCWIPNVAGNLDGSGIGVGIVPPDDLNANVGDVGGGPVGGDPGDNGGLNQDIVDTDGLADEVTAWQETRYLRVFNASPQKITVWVQFEAKTDDGQWQWVPAEPGNADQVISFEVDANQAVDLQQGDWRVNARRVRIWARSAAGEWNRFRDADLWLVPEVNPDGEHGYDAAEVQTFNFTVR
jgi:hypothetical protein